MKSGTWGTSAEFKDIKVEREGRVLYRSDFARGSDGWQVESGRWSAADGAYRQSRRRNGVSTVGDESWTDYTFTLKARKLGGREGFLIVSLGWSVVRWWSTVFASTFR